MISLDLLPSYTSKQADFLFFLLFRMTEFCKLHHNFKEKSRTFYSRWHVFGYVLQHSESDDDRSVWDTMTQIYVLIYSKNNNFLIQMKKKKRKHWTCLVWFLNICLHSHKNSSNIHNNKSFICSALSGKKKNFSSTMVTPTNQKPGNPPHDLFMKNPRSNAGAAKSPRKQTVLHNRLLW